MAALVLGLVAYNTFSEEPAGWPTMVYVLIVFACCSVCCFFLVGSLGVNHVSMLVLDVTTKELSAGKRASRWPTA